MMKDMNITKLKLKDGETVEVGNFYSASILPEKQEEAFNWLRQNGRGDVIKNDITVTFGTWRRQQGNGTICCPCERSRIRTCPESRRTSSDLERNSQGVSRVWNRMPSDYFKTYVGNRTNIKRS
jgi:hypothetical protein